MPRSSAPSSEREHDPSTRRGFSRPRRHDHGRRPLHKLPGSSPASAGSGDRDQTAERCWHQSDCRHQSIRYRARNFHRRRLRSGPSPPRGSARRGRRACRRQLLLPASPEHRWAMRLPEAGDPDVRGRHARLAAEFRDRRVRRRPMEGRRGVEKAWGARNHDRLANDVSRRSGPGRARRNRNRKYARAGSGDAFRPYCAAPHAVKSGMPSRLAVLASGRGSNLQAIIEHFDNLARERIAKVVLVASNRAEAPALLRAATASIDIASFDAADDGSTLLELLRKFRVDLVVLAGYLKRIPPAVVREYSGRIINIHPALLPAFGGEGMYGARVHEAVIGSGASESGVTVHLVDDEYDRGTIVAQWRVPVDKSDSAESLAARVLAVEHVVYPRVIEMVVILQQLETRITV